jgi:hypothetical protein
VWPHHRVSMVQMSLSVDMFNGSSIPVAEIVPIVHIISQSRLEHLNGMHAYLDI